MEVDETVTRLVADGSVPAMIEVGIDSSSRRTHEYRPYPYTVVDPIRARPEITALSLGVEAPARLWASRRPPGKARGARIPGV